MATLDTKGVEAQYVAEQIRRLGHDPLLIDTGVVGVPAATAAITREEVAQAGGMPLGQLSESLYKVLSPSTKWPYPKASSARGPSAPFHQSMQIGLPRSLMV